MFIDVQVKLMSTERDKRVFTLKTGKVSIQFYTHKSLKTTYKEKIGW